MRNSILYLLAIIIANLGFTYIPMIPLPFGEMFAPMSLLVGFVFVLRDFAQRELGHRVFAVMAMGVVISYLLADPFVAVASAVAFAVSETVDWLIYTIYKKPLKQRILISSAVSTPLDSAVFMLMLGFFSWYGMLIMVASKMLGAVIIWHRLK
jgi:uncharacterized PurR-regulated membrane protein YhhQ (DUF165 family)